MIIIKEFIELAIEQQGAGYVYGTDGEILTENILLKKISQHPSNFDSKKQAYIRAHYMGKHVFDCSGFIHWLLYRIGIVATDATASTLYYDRTTHVSEPSYGDLCFKKNTEGKIYHVGIYIGNGQIVEAQGTYYGVVISTINSKWNLFGKLKVFGTEEYASEKSDYYKVKVNDYLNFRKSPMGEIIERLYNNDIVEYDGDERFHDNNNWYKLKVNGAIGWCASKYLTPCEPTVEPDIPPEESGNCDELKRENALLKEKLRQINELSQ